MLSWTCFEDAGGCQRVIFSQRSSCRAFFRRAHQASKNPNFACKNSGACKVTAKTRYVSRATESPLAVDSGCVLRRRKCQKCRYDLCLNAGMDPEMVLNFEQKQFRFRNCLKKKMMKEMDRDAAAPSDRTPPEMLEETKEESSQVQVETPPPMVAIARFDRLVNYGPTAPVPPAAAAAVIPKPLAAPAYDEFLPDCRDERDLKIVSVQLSYSQALDEV